MLLQSDCKYLKEKKKSVIFFSFNVSPKWEPSIQIHEPTGNISHSNRHITHGSLVCTRVCGGRWGQRLLLLSRVFLRSFLSYFECQSLLLNLELTNSVRLASQQAPAIYLTSGGILSHRPFTSCLPARLLLTEPPAQYEAIL